ncbi:TIGR02678 family protein [Lentibacillus cibarius]|uniref:TIGR02678 family protein n=1 Tax=Lentibacillus cibarius TaxID=2583219 RepID=A0A549YEH8_9BACI|nr:TIGR02678 family protein [Lentibacillus cibarius]TMN21423.1 TIGR02678 family protein [Lentibacillus cibarius]TRM10299.1 TIGR02678 family protein [Lentibacillus cibarius]
METNQFDEKAEKAFGLLLERFWVLRLKEPELYQMIREREKVLKRYVDDKLGFELIVHQHFIKLEKIPVEAKSWMGMQAFQEPRDYAIFCCALAFTENRSVDEQFLLSDICEEIKDLYPGEFPLDWTNYNHRRSLVRVIKQLEQLSIFQSVEGEVDHFAMNQEQEVLYETTVYARYFMRSYPKDLFDYSSADAILASEWERHEADERRKRVYRKLFLSPVVHRESEDDADFAYIRNFRNRLREDIEEHSQFRLEVFKNAAMLVAEERKQELTLFPDQKAIMDVALHVASVLRNESTHAPDELGTIRLSRLALEEMVTKSREMYGNGWSKHFREASIATITDELVALLFDWEMLEVEPVTNAYVMKPLFGRVTGHYPKDFQEREGETNEQTS